MPKFDIVVVGTGAAASEVAYRCRSAGRSVAVVDSRPFGGTCANRGCDPKKVLVGAASAVDWARRMSAHGIAGECHIHWPELMRFKRSFTDPVPPSRESGFAGAGIEAFHGVARFTGALTLDVNGTQLEARNVVLACGAAPAKLNIGGEDALITSDDFLNLETLPESMAFIGGGYIAFEFAHLAARAGSRVTILHRGGRPLERFDEDLVDALVEHTRRVGIDVRLNSRVEAIERIAGGVSVRASGSAGALAIEASVAVHAAGRAPNIAALDLGVASVETGPRGVTVNEFLQSVSNPNVYAAGDCAASGPPLTPVAGYEGRIVAANLLEGNHQSPDYLGCAGAVFTIPPLAAVGLTEREAREKGIDAEVRREDSSGWYSSRRIAEPCSAYKTIVERGSRRILGAHILGESADELINVFALAIRAGLTADQMKRPLYSYPSHGSNIQYMLA